MFDGQGRRLNKCYFLHVKIGLDNKWFEIQNSFSKFLKAYLALNAIELCMGDIKYPW